MAVDRRHQILAAAYEIVGEEGLEGLHARSVAQKVGINHAAVHYYYPKRPDLLKAVTEYAVARFNRDRQKLLDNASGPGARVEAHLAQAEAYCRNKSRFLKNWASFFVAAIGDDALRAILANNLKDWAAGISEDIDAETKAGAVHDSSPFVNAELLVATLLGLMFLAHTEGASFDVGERLDLVAGSLLV